MTAARRTFVTLYGIGLIRIAPGTFGSLAAAILVVPAFFLPHSAASIIAASLALTVIGSIASARYMRVHHCEHDPGEIIIDEVAGQWLTYGLWLYFLDASTLPAGAPVPAPTPWALVCGFLLFRLFDIVKPWPIQWADRYIKGGFGVMFDDVLAAVPAAAILTLLSVSGVLPA